MAYFNELELFQDVTTTDATPRTLYTIPVDANSVVHLRVIVSAFRPSNADAATYEVNAAVDRGSGNAALVGLTVVTAREDVGAMTWDVTVSVSGNDALIQVTGEAAATINWTGKLEKITAS